MVPAGAADRGDGPGAGRAAGARATWSSTAGTRSSRTTSAGPACWPGEGDPLPRRRHQRRRVRPGARLLPDGGRRSARPSSGSSRCSGRWPRARPRSPPTPDRTAGRDGGGGYLHCGPVGAGHFVKMIHNGIEYGLMQAYAEGFDVLRGAAGAELPEELPLRARPAGRSPSCGGAAAWSRRGSSTWPRRPSAADPQLSAFKGAVADSGEGRWTVQAAVEEAVPAPGARRLALRPLPLARGDHLRRQAPLRHAARVRRPRRGDAPARRSHERPRPRARRLLRLRDLRRHGRPHQAQAPAVALQPARQRPPAQERGHRRAWRGGRSTTTGTASTRPGPARVRHPPGGGRRSGPTT